LCASCVVTFCWSGLFRRGKFDIVEIQNATLAGGVAIGCSSDLVIGGYGALIIGFIAGSISTFGFWKVMPFLERTIGLHDTAGIHNLHAMPGLLGGLGGIFAALTADDVYGEHIGFVYRFRAPSNATLAAELGLAWTGVDRDRYGQAGFQAAGMLTSMFLGIAGGLITAGILKLPCFCRIKEEDYFLDTPFWHELPVDHPARKAEARIGLDETQLSNMKGDNDHESTDDNVKDD